MNSYNTSLPLEIYPFYSLRIYEITIRSMREGRVKIKSLSRVILAPSLSLSIGPFMIRLAPFATSLPSPFLSVPLLVRPSNVRLDMHVVCGEGMERDGSASLSVLTGKYLSRHTPPPSTTVDHRQPPLPPSPRSRSSTPSPPPLPFFLLCLLLRRIGRTETALKMRMLDIVDYEIRQRSRPFHTHHVEIYISF